MSRHSLLFILLATCGLADALAQVGIYTCVDAKGRRLTSDRPIAECIDREQKELTPTGTVKRVLKPSMTADEAALDEERERKAADERLRLAEEKKRDRVLLARYPNRAAHDHERSQALQQIEEVIAAANRRIVELVDEGKKLQVETEFYKGDRQRMPFGLRRQLDTNDQTMAAQKRFIENQGLERQRLSARFDEELVKLSAMWAQQRAAAAAAAAATQTKP